MHVGTVVREGGLGPAPPWPPKDAASADASPELIDVVALDVAAPPLPPEVGVRSIRIPAAPLPPVAVAQLVGSVVDVAVAAPPFFKDVVPFAPVTLTQAE